MMAINSVNLTIVVNCTAIATRSSFPNYIQTLQNETGGNLTLLDACQSELCNALWGTGNADISGIGVRSPWHDLPLVD